MTVTASRVVQTDSCGMAWEWCGCFVQQENGIVVKRTWCAMHKPKGRKAMGYTKPSKSSVGKKGGKKGC